MTMTQKVVKTFKKNGLEVSELKGGMLSDSWGKDMHAIWHDNVQYAINYHGRLDDKGNPNIAHPASHLKTIFDSEIYHEKIKKIYDHLMSLDFGDIWVMSGGGSQIQAFFGNSKSYIAILYLEDEKIKIPQAEKHILVVSDVKNNRYFNGKVAKFEHPGVEVRLVREAHPDDEDYDEDYEDIYNS